MQSYSDALNKELSSTSIKKSFVRADRPNDPTEVMISFPVCIYIVPFLIEPCVLLDYFTSHTHTDSFQIFWLLV
jgi:hypothetical protein